MEYIRLNIFLIPDDESVKYSLKSANIIGKGQKELFHIDNKSFFAHITVYSPEFPQTYLTKLIEEVEKISKETNKFELSATGFGAEYGYIDIKFAKSDKVVKLHETVVNELNPLRCGRIREKYLKGIAENAYSEKQKRIIQTYGSPDVMEFYRPHLTLGRFSSSDAAEMIAPNLGNMAERKTVEVIKMGISEMGRNGTCINIIKEFNLK